MPASVVGTWTTRTPRSQAAATQPARSVVAPPPRPTTASERVKPSWPRASQQVPATASVLAASPSGTSIRWAARPLATRSARTRGGQVGQGRRVDDRHPDGVAEQRGQLAQHAAADDHVVGRRPADRDAGGGGAHGRPPARAAGRRSRRRPGRACGRRCRRRTWPASRYTGVRCSASTASRRGAGRPASSGRVCPSPTRSTRCRHRARSSTTGDAGGGDRVAGARIRQRAAAECEDAVEPRQRGRDRRRLDARGTRPRRTRRRSRARCARPPARPARRSRRTGRPGSWPAAARWCSCPRRATRSGPRGPSRGANARR